MLLLGRGETLGCSSVRLADVVFTCEAEAGRDTVEQLGPPKGLRRDSALPQHPVVAF